MRSSIAENGRTGADEDAAVNIDDILPADATANPAAATTAKRRDAAGVDSAALRFCERTLELLIDLLSQLPTRRFLHALLAEKNVLVKAKRSALFTAPAGDLFVQLLDQFEFYMGFPIDDHTGEPLAVRRSISCRRVAVACSFRNLQFRRGPALCCAVLVDLANLYSTPAFLFPLACASSAWHNTADVDEVLMSTRVCCLQELDLDKRADEAVLQLQRLLFRRWPALQDVALTNCASARSRAVLDAALAPMKQDELYKLAVTQLRLADPRDGCVENSDFLREVVRTCHALASLLLHLCTVSKDHRTSWPQRCARADGAAEDLLARSDPGAVCGPAGLVVEDPDFVCKLVHGRVCVQCARCLT
jgi:Intron-binding protein aquarius N-terminus